MEALKLQLSLHAWGTACPVVSLTHTRDNYAVGCGGGGEGGECFTLAVPFSPPFSYLSGLCGFPIVFPLTEGLGLRPSSHRHHLPSD